jgi:hypothetical protein
MHKKNRTKTKVCIVISEGVIERMDHTYFYSTINISQKGDQEYI